MLPATSRLATPIYLGGSSIDQVIELEAAAGDASNLYTTMAVKAGEVYALSFDYALRTGQSPATSTFSVFWNGAKVAEIAPTSNALTNYSVNLLSTITGPGKLELRANDSSRSVRFSTTSRWPSAAIGV